MSVAVLFVLLVEECTREHGREAVEPVRVLAHVSVVVHVWDSAQRREVERLLRKDWADCSDFASCEECALVEVGGWTVHVGKIYLEDLQPVAPAACPVNVELLRRLIDELWRVHTILQAVLVRTVFSQW